MSDGKDEGKHLMETPVKKYSPVEAGGGVDSYAAHSQPDSYAAQHKPPSYTAQPASYAAQPASYAAQYNPASYAAQYELGKVRT